MKYLSLLKPLVYRRTLSHRLRRLYSSTAATTTLLDNGQPHVQFSLQSVRDDYYVGRKLHGFTVEKVDDVSELCLTAIRLSHDATGASHLHVARDDRNNVFCVGLRTTPMDDTGVPHVLEHTTLCGSETYPCRDPFFKMLNRTLATFMNALTASDYTMYPFATQNAKDFQNLLAVYLDAVFRPLLRELDFLQEGWRLEHEDVRDPNSPIVLKGVVFNEMKGAFADSERIFAQHLQSRLLPSHTYSYVSGGDPAHIPSLTWQQLKRFHRTHYQGSNAWFYTYGDFPLDDHLRTIDSSLRLAEHESTRPDTSVPHEVRWDHPREATISCRPDPLIANPDKQTTVAIAYLTNRITNSSESLTLYVLSELIIGGPNSPFYKSLLDPNIGSSYSPATGYNNQTKEAIFSVGLQGIHRDDVEKVTSIIDATVDEVIRDGFPEERIEAVLHRIELALKHQTSIFGLGLIMGLSAPWTHGVEPAETLRVNGLVDEFRQQIKHNPNFLQDKMKEYFKCNAHRLTLVMSPEDDYEAKRMATENRILNEKLTGLTDEDLKKIFAQGLELSEKQDQIEDVSSLPTLTVSDIEPVMQRTLLEHSLIGDIPVQLSAQPTNGIVYFRGVLDCHRILPEELKPTLPLFCSVLTRMGAGNLDYRQMAQRMELKTGGLSMSPLLAEHPADAVSFDEGICIYSNCLERNAKDMWALWTDIFNGARLSDADRLRTLVSETASELAANLPGSGHVYAMTRAASTLNPLAALKETFQGLDQIKIMKKFAESRNLDELIEKLQTTAKLLLSKDHLRLSVNATPEYLPVAREGLQGLISSVSESGIIGSSSSDTQDAIAFRAHSCRQHVVLPLPVNFVSRSLPAVRYHHKDFAPLRILSRLMTTKFLHREIREKGGAYGGGCVASPSGNFNFYSYRDPRNIKTLKSFDEAVSWASRSEFSDRDIDESKISIFAEVDRPVAPGDKGKSHFLNGITDDMKQQHRERLMKASRDDLLRVTDRYLGDRRGPCGEVILGPKKMDEDSESTKDTWHIIKNEF